MYHRNVASKTGLTVTGNLSYNLHWKQLFCNEWSIYL